MEPPSFLILVFLITSAAAGVGAGAEIRNITIYGTVGSAVTFPAVEITEDTFYDLRTADQNLLFTYHGIGNVRPLYRHRAQFNSELGTFELRGLTEEDSGNYEQVVDMKLVAVLYLHVIEPLKRPTLRMNKTIDGNQSSIDLECSVQGPEIIGITILRDGEEVPKGISRKGLSGHLTLEACDPGSSGKYTCTVRNPLENKTSPEVKVTQDEYDCKKNTDYVKNGSTGPTVSVTIIVIVIVIIAAVIGVVFLVHRCGKEDGKRFRCGCEDEESGNTSQETSPIGASPIKENPSGGEPRNGSYQQVSMNDLKESGEDMGPQLPTEEDKDPQLPTEEDKDPQLPTEEDKDPQLPTEEDKDPQLPTEEDKDPQLPTEEDMGPTEEDSPQRLLLSHHGQDEKPTMELKVDGSASDHGREANG